ncbi:homocysteine-responsive endoplasmic reticulum-resident ubiquitin-like domain member 2 protein isoform X2 [Syngnathoides biaculeatus]|uniref:homocysteine-responsive endoplasmic reticulum-resident ubiquitin-like domain member 2 protein isoform X2 n=1 Tax=Syngnathoides biaculeatus TaxID=300417 RepID=UPI002ADD8E9A|nr:homocysteine-responsive endoplasmic reticulum-resident ubiquitin-like domain member 2 protein isoform X2 [Syngnathoides biaculeatus]
MASGAADTPVTLVIKTPDQKYEDHTVNCFLSWTVEKLKSHIANVYPGKPRSRDQRLVYLGNLLEDHLHLRDVLRQHNEHHVLHLVYNFCTQPDSHGPSSVSMLNAGNSKTATSALPDTSLPEGPDGLRRRGAILNFNPRSPAGIPQWPQGGARLPLQGAQMLMPMQMWWWQQIYARHYYMQYQAAVAAFQPPSFPAATSQPPPPPRPNETARPPLAPVRAADPVPENLVPPAAADANIQMNAQAGGDVLNEDGLNRDWLDWLYALFRVCVLLSFVYFYSTFGRLVVVAGAMMLVYLHQVGWFPFRTLEQQQPQPQPPDFQDPEQIQAREEAEMQRGLRELERVMDHGMEEAEREDRGLLTAAWSFVSTFFASLVPEGWPQQPPDFPPGLRPR